MVGTGSVLTTWLHYNSRFTLLHPSVHWSLISIDFIPSTLLHSSAPPIDTYFLVQYVLYGIVGNRVIGIYVPTSGNALPCTLLVVGLLLLHSLPELELTVLLLRWLSTFSCCWEHSFIRTSLLLTSFCWLKFTFNIQFLRWRVMLSVYQLATRSRN